MQPFVRTAADAIQDCEASIAKFNERIELRKRELQKIRTNTTAWDAANNHIYSLEVMRGNAELQLHMLRKYAE